MSAERALLAAFISHLGPVQVVTYRAVPWHSATYSGARHLFCIEAEDESDFDAFACDIVEADIVLPRGFVADVLVKPATSSARQIEIEALTIDA
jgi:hypothetical protein